MPSFEIRYEDFIRDASRRAGSHLFYLRSGDTEAMFPVEFPDELGRQWGLAGRPNGDEIQRRAALDCLKRHLPGVGALTGQHGQRLLLTAWDPRDLGDGWTVYKVPKECPYEWKECRYQERGRAGTLCTVAHPTDYMRGLTTRVACEQCGLPSTEILCDNLVCPQTTGYGSDFAGIDKRTLVTAQCDIGKREFDQPAREAASCVPGGRDCWVQTYEPQAPEPPVVPGAAQFSIGEAIDQVNAAFWRRYQRKLIVIEHARSIEDLGGECPTDDSLQHKLQVVASLLRDMNLGGLLPPEEAEGSQGPIDLLERLAARDFAQLPEQHLRNLRNINKLAAGYPRHTKVKNIDRAHTELGLPYPVSDYARAWAIVRETFIQTLRQLALHLG